MTGTEIVGAALAAGKGLEKGLKSSKKENELLLNLARGTPEAQLAAAKYGQRMLIKQTIITTIYEKLARLVGVSHDYFQNDFPAELAARTADIPDSELVAPPAAVAVPAMQALSYSLDEPDLKEMYLNLLATASDARRQDEAHPAFADIIHQLSPAEARALPSVLQWPNLPTAEVRLSTEDSGYQRLCTNLTPLVRFPQTQRLRAGLTSLWLDNWARLGLGSISYDSWINSDEAYAWCDEHPDYLEIGANDETFEATIQRGHFLVSDFGKAFKKSLSLPEVVDARGAHPGNEVIDIVVERLQQDFDSEPPPEFDV